MRWPAANNSVDSLSSARLYKKGQSGSRSVFSDRNQSRSVASSEAAAMRQGQVVGPRGPSRNGLRLVPGLECDVQGAEIGGLEGSRPHRGWQ